jgi:hypothetical protein
MVCLMSGAALPVCGAIGAIGGESGGRSRISGKGEASAPTGSAHPGDDSGVVRPAGNSSRSVLADRGANSDPDGPPSKAIRAGCHDVAQHVNRARRYAQVAMVMKSRR